MICDGELTPGQLIQLEDVVKVKVVDRTWLILDIFAQHAKSREGKAQVSLAQMQYLHARDCAAGVSRSHDRPVDAPVVPPVVSVRADPVRQRSRPTGAASGTRWPSCVATCG